MKDSALMNTLRENLILERAKNLYSIMQIAPEQEAIDVIKRALRLERDGGITTGINQAQRFADELRKAS